MLNRSSVLTVAVIATIGFAATGPTNAAPGFGADIYQQAEAWLDLYQARRD